MTPKKTGPDAQGHPTVAGTVAKLDPADSPGADSMAALPAEVAQGGWITVLLAFMMFVTPAIGVPHEEMLQDTLKSMMVSFSAISAGLIFFWQQRHRQEPLRWHALMWLPLSLMFYALASMLWSHAYLGGVEAIRWFVFSLLLWLGLNTLSRDRLPHLALGIHAGALVASLWTALQFWFDFTYFPQGPNPASTFVNRNFFAEFAVCTIPFSFYLLMRARNSLQISLLSLTNGFVVVALMMTGTRGALMALWLLLIFVLPLIAMRYRRQLAISSWHLGQKLLACGLLAATVLALGLIQTGNPKLTAEARGNTAFERAFKRTATISVDDNSLGVRFVMWKATSRIIQAHPLRGVGAGAWEVDVPLYQADGTQLETDYYVHNEILQLLAEYGLVGWMFLLALLGYLSIAAWKTLRNRGFGWLQEAPERALVLSSLLALLIVSNIGFPWRMATTDAIFALALGFLTASDARLGVQGKFAAQQLSWKPVYSKLLGITLMFCLALAIYISQQAAMAESRIVRSVRLVLTITQSGDVNNPRWNATKLEILELVKEGTRINPHYRKLTPMVADELARWGDWPNAVWIWESVVSSRPYVVALLTNIARGYAQMGAMDKAFEYLERSKNLQPKAASVRSLEVVLLSRSGRTAEAQKLAKQYLAEGIYDYDLLDAGWVLGVKNGDLDLAIQSMELRNKSFPDQQVDGLVKLGYLYAIRKKDDAKALMFYKAAMAASPEKDKEATRQRIPPDYRSRL